MVVPEKGVNFAKRDDASLAQIRSVGPSLLFATEWAGMMIESVPSDALLGDLSLHDSERPIFGEDERAARRSTVSDVLPTGPAAFFLDLVVAVFYLERLPFRAIDADRRVQVGRRLK
jgi:hypothetical protein